MWRHVVAGGAALLTHSSTLILPNNGSNITTAAGDTFTVVYEGSGVSRVLGYQRASGAPLQASPVTGWPRSARTSNTILGTADNATIIDITANTFTQTFTAAATLGASWSVVIKNSGTGDITLDPNSSETIDGLATFIMYPGEARLITCDGSGFYSVVLTPFARKFTASTTFTKPPGYQWFDVEAQGAGGGGGSGSDAALTNKTGGGGGGGGARAAKRIATADVGSTETVTVGTGGLGGTAITANTTDGNDGTDGGTSSFGSWVSATGGIKGTGGKNGNSVNGGAGGTGYDLTGASANAAGTELSGAGSNTSGTTGARAPSSAAHLALAR